ncbi:MAG: PRC-barrel domain-containing protein [Candidatus Thermoplasmatota archaeon]
MHIFNRKKKKRTKSDKDLEEGIDELISEKNKENDKDKKTKLGLKLPKFKKTKKEKKKTKEKNTRKEKKTVEDDIEEGIEDFPSVDEIEEDKTPFFKKNKNLFKKDMKGKPVFLEETGEKLGEVYDSVCNENGEITGYKIKDKESDAVLNFSIDHFDEGKKGLIFIPRWYTQALKTIEKLEFKDRVSPELTALLSEDENSNREAYEIFVKHDDEMAEYIEQTISLKKMLNKHLNLLEKKRVALKDDLMDLTERRLIKDIDRREFAEDVMKHRKKVNILDVNINKCRQLLRRLDNTSFGVIGEDFFDFEKEDENEDGVSLPEGYDDFDLPTKKEDTDLNMVYKEKYFDLKEKFDQLEDQYEELKHSVEKLVET